MPDKTNNLAIFLDVERLAPAYDNDAWFALNVTAAFERDNTGIDVTDDLVRAYLKPWIWSWPTIRVIGVRGDDLEVMPDPIPLIDPAAPTQSIDGLSKSLDAELEQDLKTVDFTRFTRELNDTHVLERLTDNRREWRGFLSNVSTYHADTAHHVRLVRFFKLPSALTFNEVLIAPIFDVLARDPNNPMNVTDRAVPRIPNTPDCLRFPADQGCPVQRLLGGFKTKWQTGQSLDGVLYSWEMEPTAGLIGVTTYQPRCVFALPEIPESDTFKAGDGFVDVRELWISPDAIKTGDDWMEQIEHRAANALDLAQRLIEAARGVADTVVPTPEFHDAFLALLHDTTDIGVLVSADGTSLAEDLVRFLARRNVVPRPERLIDYARNFVSPAAFSIDDWKKRLEAVLKARRKPGLPDAPAAGASKEEVKAYLEQLDALRLALADEDVLSALVLRQWQDAVEAATDVDPIRWLQISADVASFLGSNPLRPRLLLASAGTGWRALKDFSSAQMLAPHLEKAIVDYYVMRFGAATTGDYGTRAPRPTRPSGAIDTAVIAWLESDPRALASAKEVLDRAVPDPTVPTLAPDGIQVQMAKPVTSDVSSPFDARLRGACLMMRAPSQPWSILNLAQYAIRGETIPGEDGPLYNEERVFAIPKQIGYRNGLRQVNVVYRNQPIAGRAPAALLSRKRQMKPGMPGDPAAIEVSPIVDLWSPYGGTPANRPRLPRLVFGEKYDIAGFVVGLSGHLPRELADPVRPWRLRNPGTPADPPTTRVKKQVPYLRTETVSTLRLQANPKVDPKNATDTPWIPPIPEKVFPLARRLQPLTPLELDPNSHEATGSDQSPLVLLVDGTDVWSQAGKKEAAFFVRPPSTHWVTWDAWNDARFKTVRARVIGKYHEFADLRDGEQKDRADLSFDDPAVAGFKAELLPLFSNSQKITGPSIAFVKDPAKPDLEAVQSSAIKVTMASVASGGTAAITPDGGGLRVTVPAGEVWELVLTPEPIAGAADKFSKGLWPTVPPPESLFKPTKILIEVAKALPVQTDALARALHASIAPKHDPAADTIDVRFVPSATEVNAVRPYLHRADVLVQRWRWQGRPLFWHDGTRSRTDFPFIETATNPALLERLDGVLFGDRDEDDYLITGARVDFGGDAPGTGLPIYTHDASASPEALYYRFAIRVFSRYEGLLKARASLASRQLARPADPNAAAPELWQRLVVPCRRRTRLHPPVVKLIVPLTQARIDGGEQSPGWLVVLEETWQQYAGLAESFAVHVVTTTVPFEPPGTEIVLQEAGPDPIDTLDPAQGLAGPIGTKTFAFTPVGPIGYTFDTDTDAPLFVRAAFFVPAPRLGGDAALPAVPDYFFKLQFQRRLEAGGGIADIDSELTEPVWAQIVPPSDIWDTDRGSRHVDELRYDGANRRYVLRDQPGTVVTILPSRANRSAFNSLEIRALLTDPVTDAFGRAEQEVVRGGDLFALPNPGAPITTFAHIVELQRPANVVTADLREDLFPSSSDRNLIDAKRRITRISPRIEPLVR